MDHTGLLKASKELDSAVISVAALSAARQFPQIEKHWVDFLEAATRIYTTLEVASKNNHASSQWFEAKLAERSADPLLSYVECARNVNSHTLGQIAATAPPSSTELLGGRNPIQMLAGEVFPMGVTLILKGIWGSGAPFEVKMTPSIAVLLPVTSTRRKSRRQRDETVFNPPTSHLGQSIDSNSPVRVAELMLAYLRALIEDAQKLP